MTCLNMIRTMDKKNIHLARDLSQWIMVYIVYTVKEILDIKISYIIMY